MGQHTACQPAHCIKGSWFYPHLGEKLDRQGWHQNTCFLQAMFCVEGQEIQKRFQGLFFRRRG